MTGTNNIRAGVSWLLMDMTLVSGGMTMLVKMQGATYPAFQLVFIRAMIGLMFIIPLIWRHRHELARIKYPWRNVVRITCNAIALTTNFIAITLLPLATVNAVGFSRPMVTMGLAVLMLHEKVSRIRWAGASIAFLGVLFIIAPGGGTAFDWKILVVLASVVFGALATIQTRALKLENSTVMMVFYTVGLAIITAIPSALTWKPVATADWLPLLGIGFLAQLGQYCFLQAYRSAEASILAPIGYLSIIFVTAVGYFAFNEVPEPRVIFGVCIMLAALIGASMIEYRQSRKR